MQQRFCLCGRAILVQFCLRGFSWKPTFWSVAHYHGEKVERCPTCGRRLDINDLS